jgi:hypothetical protein
LGIRILGYKNYVGGLWEQIGSLQYRFLVAEGLRPGHVLLDVGCGPLRGGRFFIPYLDRGNYLGIDKEAALIQAGVKDQLTPAVLAEKRPEFLISSDFDFQKLSKKPDFAIAQSLFTHLAEADILLCLKHLKAAVRHCRFFATFFEGASGENSGESHSLNAFFYSREEMASFAERTGWKFRYIGDWKHPRRQMMTEFSC